MFKNQANPIINESSVRSAALSQNRHWVGGIYISRMWKLPAEPWIDGCRGTHLHFYILTCLSPDACCTMDHHACCHIFLPSITSICLPPPLNYSASFSFFNCQMCKYCTSYESGKAFRKQKVQRNYVGILWLPRLGLLSVGWGWRTGTVFMMHTNY